MGLFHDMVAAAAAAAAAACDVNDDDANDDKCEIVLLIKNIYIYL